MGYFLLYVYLTIQSVILYSGCGYAFLKHNNFAYFNYFSYQNKKNNDQLMKLLWRRKISCDVCNFYVHSDFNCYGSYIFIADRFGVIRKLDIDTGKCIWSKNLFGSSLSHRFLFGSSILLSTGITVSGGHCYIGSELAKVYALDVNTGRESWVAQVSGEVISRPVVSQGLVLVCTNNGVFYALDERNGIIRWMVNLDIPSGLSFLVQSIPVVSSDIVIFGDVSGVINAFNINTGQLIWQKSISNIQGTTDLDKVSNIVEPIVINNVVYAIAYNGNMVALDIASGSLIWSKAIGSLINIILENGVIYLIDQEYHIIAIDSSNGNIIWSRRFQMYHQLNSMVSYKDYVLIGDSAGYLHWFFKKDGIFFKKKKVSVGCFNKLLIVVDKIVIYDDNGNVSVWLVFN